MSFNRIVLARMLLLAGMLPLFSACDTGSSAEVTGVASSAGDIERIMNREAVIPPQCYTKTEGIHNPCYVCHQNRAASSSRINEVNDAFLQGLYAFSDVGMSNHWKNLFKDRRAAIAAMPDEEIDAWIAEDNYSSLVRQLEQDAGWRGYQPDLAGLQLAEAAFDEQGFARDGSHWVAFNYKPFPSTFWPTNGSTDDVMIRLPERFREIDGRYHREIYLLNLSLLEAAIKNLEEIGIPPVDETQLGIDINQDGKLAANVDRLRRRDRYLGDATDIEVLVHLYPQGTEFLHSVRYVGIGPDGEIGPSVRMKELRYMKKIRLLNAAQLSTISGNEQQDKREGNLPNYQDFGDRGFDNGRGWQLLGFIEDEHGKLRQQTHEEHLFCMGCHSNIGATIDHAFAFARKPDGASGWGYIDLEGMPDAPALGSSRPEYLEYLERTGGGDEFRQNREMRARYFDENGRLVADRVRGKSVHELILPTSDRARKLNKAYYRIVMEQSYTQGRDAVLVPATNVFERIDPAVQPLSPQSRVQRTDIRLDWRQADAGSGGS